MVALTKEVDIRLRENFFPLLRKVFMQCDDYTEAMRYFYNQEAFINTAHHWPDLKICYPVGKHQLFDYKFAFVELKKLFLA